MHRLFPTFSLCIILQQLLPFATAFVHQGATFWNSASTRGFRFSSSLNGASRNADVSANAGVAGLEHVAGVRDVADEHTTFLLDMWGVMHDGTRPYEGVLDTVRRLREAGKEMIILSNSSKRRDNAVRMLKKLGFDPDVFEQIITSGEVSHRMLAGDETLECSRWSVLTDLIKLGPAAQKVFVFGSGDGDEEYCTSSGWSLAPIDEANLILARGTFTINDGSGNVVSKKENPDHYFQVLEKTLAAAADRGLPMLVSNPDKVRPDEGLPPMPGAIGDAYEVALGHSSDTHLVKRIGKPFREVYDLALRGKDSTSACMVGDALETDIAGGSKVGCTTLWVVNDGIHGPAVDELGGGVYEQGASSVVRTFNEEKGHANGDGVSPMFVVPTFRW